jgi:hypothetical protein
MVDSQVISISINRALVPVGKFSLFLLKKALLYSTCDVIIFRYNNDGDNNFYR